MPDDVLGPAEALKREDPARTPAHVCELLTVSCGWAPKRAYEVEAQLRLGLPMRMGIGTGSAESRGDDYFGPALNRAARVVAAGHGGQILVANSTAALVSGIGLVDLGERRLRDLSGAG